jgi:hypothetical protein
VRYRRSCIVRFSKWPPSSPALGVRLALATQTMASAATMGLPMEELPRLRLHLDRKRVPPMSLKTTQKCTRRTGTCGVHAPGHGHDASGALAC